MNDALKFGSEERESSAPCEAWQRLRSLAASGGELDAAEEARLAAHLDACGACSTDLALERETLALLAAQHAEPDAALLASCRAGLQDALDREEDRGWIARSFGRLLPSSWISPRPAWSAAILLLIGFSVGLLAPRLLLHRSADHSRKPAPAHVTSAPPPLLLAQNSRTQGEGARDSGSSSAPEISAPEPGSTLHALDVHQATVAGINVLPAGAGAPPQVQLQLAAQQPYMLQGTVDDGDVRDVLLYVLRHDDLFAPDIRLGAINAVSPRSRNPEIRSALSRVMQQDASAAVRLKALQALSGPEPDDLVTRMLLDAISTDQDPSVREQAVDTLRDLASSGQVPTSAHVLTVLRDRAHNDPDPYIRTQSAAVVRELVSQQSGTP